jgi:hypothetical protein
MTEGTKPTVATVLRVIAENYLTIILAGSTLLAKEAVSSLQATQRTQPTKPVEQAKAPAPYTGYVA